MLKAQQKTGAAQPQPEGARPETDDGFAASAVSRGHNDMTVRQYSFPVGLMLISLNPATERSAVQRGRNTLRALIASLALAIGALAQAHPQVDPATIDTGHPTGHVGDRGNQTWPPQPPGIQAVRPLTTAGDEAQVAGVRERRAAARERMAGLRADVRQALGGRFTRAKMVEGRDKSGAVLPTRLVYFSHSMNSTVEVTVDDQRVLNVKTVPAMEYQPEITDAEALEAEGLARTHFAAEGQGRVAELKSFAILAYQPSGKGFYATRVLYVSFHLNSDAPPEYVAWVDLTQRRVLRSRQEGQ